MNPPPPLKKVTPSFWSNPPPPLKIRNCSSPLFCSNPPLYKEKFWLAPPPFFTKSCFMKPIVRDHEIIVFHQDLTKTGSANKKIMVFFHSPHNTGGQVLSGGTQEFIENAFYGMYHYGINIKIGFNW